MTLAATKLDPDARRLCTLIDGLDSAAALLLRLPGGHIVAASEPAGVLLGLHTDDLRGRPVTAVTRGLWRSDSMRLLLAGGLRTFSGPTSIRRGDGQLHSGAVWAGSIETTSRQWVVLAFQDGATDTFVLPMLKGADDAVVVMGEGDRAGGFAAVSENVELLLGYDAATFVKLSIAGVVHADDFNSLLGATTEIMPVGGSCSLSLRLRHADGRWIRVRTFLAVIGTGESARAAFTMVPDAPGGRVASADSERLEELEVRLRRIAVEIAAVGALDGMGAAMAPEVAAALSELSPRRREIVSRLQAGERVPTIAETMFLSQSTVRNHLSVIFRRFGVSSQEELNQLLRGRVLARR